MVRAGAETGSTGLTGAASVGYPPGLLEVPHRGTPPIGVKRSSIGAKMTRGTFLLSLSRALDCRPDGACA